MPPLHCCSRSKKKRSSINRNLARTDEFTVHLWRRGSFPSAFCVALRRDEHHVRGYLYSCCYCLLLLLLPVELAAFRAELLFSLSF